MRAQWPGRASRRAAAAAALLLALAGASSFYELPTQPAPELYGALRLDARSSAAGAKPVSFSHASHRMHASCRLCHVELHFAMEAGGSGVTEAANRSGEFCGACHDGERAFAHDEAHCASCHTGEVTAPQGLRKALKRLPKRSYGNEVDWSAAVERGLIRPAMSLDEPDRAPMPFAQELDVPVAWSLIPPARFSHRAHLAWLDCTNCHPDLFAVRRRGADEMSMQAILDGRFCGTCHGSVALPLDDCRACHPTMRGER